MDLVPYAVPFFLALIALEFAFGRLRHHDTYRLNDSINSLSLGILSTAIKLLGLDIGARVFAATQAQWALFSLDPASAWTWLWAVLVYDFCYYWFHRISHERQLFWAAHVVHHQSEEFNLTTALRQTSTGFLVTWVFYLPCFLLGVPIEVFVTVASAHLIYQFWIHTRHLPKLGFLEWFLVTASNHRVHHAQNARYVDRNYGGLLIVWDRLFGTFQEEREDEAPVYGILGPLHSWNPLWANLHIYAQMVRDAWFAGNWRDRLHVLVARTGWRPPEAARRHPLLKTGIESFHRFDPPMPSAVGAYVAFQFVSMLALSLWIDRYGMAFGPVGRAALFLFLLVGLMALGALMEKLGSGWRWEALRLLGCALFLLFQTGASHLGAAPAAAGLIYLLVSALLLARLRAAPGHLHAT
jgi:sterol desaturase/sphingolipid hydroxylase (fatty acid hydroxylase superfamily)